MKASWALYIHEEAIGRLYQSFQFVLTGFIGLRRKEEVFRHGAIPEDKGMEIG